ncbi:MAG: hypothetical protein BV456_00620 [Thermoplasmata archaeon M8B2D]|nr:MAG: hypothetical protein BV456_00620 [Thermoplasmata archaeon M8B2D]
MKENIQLFGIKNKNGEWLDFDTMEFKNYLDINCFLIKVDNGYIDKDYYYYQQNIENQIYLKEEDDETQIFVHETCMECVDGLMCESCRNSLKNCEKIKCLLVVFFSLDWQFKKVYNRDDEEEKC